MSCYLRHIKDILDEADLFITPANKRQSDQAIHQAVGIAYKDCPAAWKRIKEDIESDEKERLALIQQLQIAVR